MRCCHLDVPNSYLMRKGDKKVHLRKKSNYPQKSLDEMSGSIHSGIGLKATFYTLFLPITLRILQFRQIRGKLLSSLAKYHFIFLNCHDFF